jgi:NAD-dependent dihydropyrimidine dehydrogenase PreA subunit
MSEFIQVVITQDKCTGIGACGKCVQVCPVNIFGAEADRPFIVEENQDECTLCDLCLEECTPDAVVIRKLYE